MTNIVVFMSDEHNPLYSSVYGHKTVHTPNLDRLAKMGTVFENAYCNSPVCSASRSAFMSGKPVHQTQSYNNCNVIKSDYPSYGRVLHDQGAYSVHIGKTDVWNDADTLGFTEMITPTNRKTPGDVNFRRQPLSIRDEVEKRANGYGPKEEAFKKDTMWVNEGIDWLKNKAPHLDQPWSICMNTGAPHFPHFVTQELWDMYPDGGDLPEYGSECESAKHPYAMDLRAHFQNHKINEEQIRGLRRGYLGGVTYVDRQIGRVLDVLEESGQIEDTVFVYTSDHGEMLGKFGMWWKCSLYEDSVRIPMIAAGPGFEKGNRVNTPVSLFDLQAAIFKAVDKVRPTDWWGTPLQDIPQDDQERSVFSEYHGHGTRSGAFMIRKGKWKLLYNMKAPHQLFDLEKDPNELMNIAEQNISVVEELEKELRRYCSPEAENDRAHHYEQKQLEAIQNISE